MRLEEMKKFFLSQGYPPELIDNSIKKPVPSTGNITTNKSKKTRRHTSICPHTQPKQPKHSPTHPIHTQTPQH